MLSVPLVFLFVFDFKEPASLWFSMFKKSIFDKYLILPLKYDILAIGKGYCRVHDWSPKRKPPVLPHWGFSIPFWDRWFIPEAGYRLLLLFIQTFADVVGNYACQNGEDKRYCRIVHDGHPLSVPVSGVVDV